jgi:hypothetical protein
MTIKVGIMENDPFIINKNKISGLTIDLWEHIADKYDIKFKYFTIKNLNKAIEDKKYDIYLGKIYITPERIRQLDFTTPYYFTNYSVTSLKKDNTQKFISAIAQLVFMFLIYTISSMLIHFFTTKNENININEVLHYTFESMFQFWKKKNPDLLAKINLLFVVVFVFIVFYYIYLFFIKKDASFGIPNKPILVDDKNQNLIKYIKSQGAQVKIVKNSSNNLDSLLDLYLTNPEESSGIFVSEEGQIAPDGSIFDRNPKYKNFTFKRYNFGKSQLTIGVKKNHPLFYKINSEIMNMKDNGKLFNISKKWLNATHSNQLK